MYGFIGVSGAGTLIDQDEIHRMVMSENIGERIMAVYQIQANFTSLTNKKLALEDLHRLTLDKDRNVKVRIAGVMGFVLPLTSDKNYVWNDLHNLTLDEDNNVRWSAADIIGIAFPHIPNEVQAWEDLHRLTQDKDDNVRWSASAALCIALPYITDKVKAMEDLHRLIHDRDNGVRWRVTDGLGVACPYISNKKQIWKDLIYLLYDKDSIIRWRASKTLGIVYSYLSDKDLAWEDLHRLILHEDCYVRSNAAYSIGFAFLYIFDKKQAWEDLQNLTHDKEVVVRRGAIDAILAAFPYVPNKNQAWHELHRLTQDKEKDIQWHATNALGTAFPHALDKTQAWNDIYELTQSRDAFLRAHAYYSLGKISIFKSTEAENKQNFKRELEVALGFFEESLKEEEAYFSNPAKFCLPFYRSFYTIIFNDREADIEIQRYLSEARRESSGSESKEKLLEAIQNLANALSEANETKQNNLDVMKRDLNAYRRYCERTAELLRTTEKKAPGATRLIRKGLPIIDQRIKDIISNIQEKSNALCRQTLETPFEDLGKEVNRIGKNLLNIRDPIGLDKSINNMRIALSAICAKMPKEERREACELLEKANDELYIEDKIDLINMVLSKISSQISATKNIQVFESKLDKMIVSLKPGIREELVISVGAEFAGTGTQHVITIPLQEISYPDLEKDLEKINGKDTPKLSSLPAKLAEKVKSYLVRNKKDEVEEVPGLHVP